MRSLSNRIFLKISGKWFRAYSIVKHVGSSSGRHYRNPVSAYPLADGFVIAVLYGAHSHWVRNVMAAGRFTLQTKGHDHLLERPEIIAAAQALPAFPALYRRMLRSRGTREFLWAHRAESETGATYRRPSWVRVRLVNPLFRFLVLRAGLGRRGEQNLMRVLRVRGRRSGREHEVPVRIAAWNGNRYVVSLLGEAEWARNLRAAGTAQLLVGTSIEPVTAREIRAKEKQAFLLWYCQHPAHRLSARAGLKVDPANLTQADIDRVDREHPIFRLDPAAAPGHPIR
ncbi:MAG TPA: nitroreductase/quinone reductase family protein [Streptosporangiaceae bacterium]